MGGRWLHATPPDGCAGSAGVQVELSDPFQGLGDDAGFVLGEVSGEVFFDPGDVDFGRSAEDRLAMVGEFDSDGAAVVWVGNPLEDGSLFEPVDHRGQSCLADRYVSGQIGHSDAGFAGFERVQHDVVGPQVQIGALFQLFVEYGGESPGCLDDGAPGASANVDHVCAAGTWQLTPIRISIRNRTICTQSIVSLIITLLIILDD